MIEIRIRDLIGIIAICLFVSLSFICFTQSKHISDLRQAIEQRDSLLNELIYQHNSNEQIHKKEKTLWRVKKNNSFV